MLSAERIVFGGGVMSDERLLPYICERARRQLAGYLPVDARAGGFDRLIVPPALGDRAGIGGAMLLAEQAGNAGSGSHSKVALGTASLACTANARLPATASQGHVLNSAAASTGSATIVPGNMLQLTRRDRISSTCSQRIN